MIALFPSDPVITRWVNWLRAALYYNNNLSAVYTIVNNWTRAGFLVSRPKDAINVEDLVLGLVEINQCWTLAANVEFKWLYDYRSIRTAAEYAIIVKAFYEYRKSIY